MSEPLKLMCITAHPDDEALGVGFTLAKYAAEGVQISLLTATRGERGWSGAPEENPGPQALGRLREQELMEAAKVLGVQEVNFLDYMDGELAQVDALEAIGKIVCHLRRVRPQVVVTFDPTGAYGHPDHIAVSQFTLGAVVAAADSEYHDAERRPAYRVPKVYFMIDTERLVSLYTAVTGEQIKYRVDGEIRRHFGWPSWAATAWIDARAHWETGLAAIACHQTQVQELMGQIQNIPENFDLSDWAVQTFYRVYSLVNRDQQSENDLFTGLR